MKKILLIAASLAMVSTQVAAQTDAALISATIPYYVSEVGSPKITGIVKNNGSSTISGFDINWTEGISTYTYSVSNSLAAGATYAFTHPDEITSVPTGYSATIVVTVVAANDGNSSNNSQTKVVEGIAFVPKKVVVGEEATGTWCGWCPRGAVWMEYMEENYPEDWIGIAVHNSDPMENIDYDAWIGTKISGYPSGLVDRKSDIDPSAFETAFEAAIDDFAWASVDIQPLINDQDEVWVRVRTQFAKSMTKDMRIAVVMVEDNVTGSSSGYGQVNYYSYQYNNLPLEGAGHNWQTEPGTVPASSMEYDDVARELITSATGLSGSVPQPVAANEVVITSLSEFSWNSDYKKEDSRIIAMLLNNENGSVINAAESKLLNYEKVDIDGVEHYNIEGDTYLLNPEDEMVPLAVEPVGAGSLNIKLYPNPASNVLHVDGITSLAMVTIYDMKGTLIMKSELVDQSLDISALQAGIYAVTVESNGKSAIERITIVK